ncbi:hypothetical protein BC829DRAFT_440297 [Chytridium lagenaria]|nr:hypothetical protein BC829DRAFT_440297 [Chytridium lagenaria]
MAALVNASVTVIAGLATTFAAGMVVSYGLQFLIRDHNLRQTLTRFRKRQQSALQALKDIEAACESVLVPALEELGRSWHASSTGNLNGMEGHQSFWSSDLGAVASEGLRYRRWQRMQRAAAVVPYAHESRSLVPIGKHGAPTAVIVDAARSKFSVVKSSRLDRDDISTTHSHAPVGNMLLHPTVSSMSPSDRDSARRRLMELDQQAVRLLEKLESIHPGDMAEDLVVPHLASIQHAQQQQNQQSELASSHLSPKNQNSSPTPAVATTSTVILAPSSISIATSLSSISSVITSSSVVLSKFITPSTPCFSFHTFLYYHSRRIYQHNNIRHFHFIIRANLLGIIIITLLCTPPLSVDLSFASLPLIIDSISLDDATVTHIRSCVETCRSRKQAAVLRLRQVLNEVDRLLDALDEVDEAETCGGIGGVF